MKTTPFIPSKIDLQTLSTSADLVVGNTSPTSAISFFFFDQEAGMAKNMPIFTLTGPASGAAPRIAILANTVITSS